MRLTPSDILGLNRQVSFVFCLDLSFVLLKFLNLHVDLINYSRFSIGFELLTKINTDFYGYKILLINIYSQDVKENGF